MRHICKMATDKWRIWGIVGAIIGIGALHYATSIAHQTEHAIYAKLYYLPIAMGALIYGLRGGLLTAFLVIATYGPSCVLLRNARSAALDVEIGLDLAVMLGVAGLIGVVVDRERAHHRRAQEAERLAALGQVAAMMAHEMKTPLITMGGFARNLLKQMLKNEDRQKLEIIVAEVARLERLVHEALDFARQRSLHLSRCRISRILDRVQHIVGPLADSKGVSIKLTCDLDDVELMCDCEKIQQVMINLMDNAIAHTPSQGRVVCRVHAIHTDLFRFEICDSGPGIPDALKESLFQPFSGLRKNGSGLGLAIAQRIVRLHGGKIEAKNLSQGGAMFQFNLPANSGCGSPDEFSQPQTRRRPKDESD